MHGLKSMFKLAATHHTYVSYNRLVDSQSYFQRCCGKNKPTRILAWKKNMLKEIQENVLKLIFTKKGAI